MLKERYLRNRAQQLTFSGHQQGLRSVDAQNVAGGETLTFPLIITTTIITDIITIIVVIMIVITILIIRLFSLSTNGCHHDASLHFLSQGSEPWPGLSLRPNFRTRTRAKPKMFSEVRLCHFLVVKC